LASPVAAFHTWTERSANPAAICLPSVEIATIVTGVV